MGLDLGTEWRARRWRRLLQLIDRLPRDSQYFEAVTNDEKLADQIAARPDADDDRPPRRKMSDWSPQVELLTAILDRLAEVTQAVAVGNGARPRKLPRAPRPVTAIDRARNRRREAKHRSVVARVLPHKQTQQPPAA